VREDPGKHVQRRRRDREVPQQHHSVIHRDGNRPPNNFLERVLRGERCNDFSIGIELEVSDATACDVA
jgi:hypothetical protein